MSDSRRRWQILHYGNWLEMRAPINMLTDRADFIWVDVSESDDPTVAHRNACSERMTKAQKQQLERKLTKLCEMS